jgi:hypothetical protein
MSLSRISLLGTTLPFSVRDLSLLTLRGGSGLKVDKLSHTQNVLSYLQGLSLAALDAVILWNLALPRLICFSVRPTYKETRQPFSRVTSQVAKGKRCLHFFLAFLIYGIRAVEDR